MLPAWSSFTMSASWQGSPVQARPFSLFCRPSSVGKSGEPVRPTT
jgi:hypothetical protein